MERKAIDWRVLINTPEGGQGQDRRSDTVIQGVPSYKKKAPGTIEDMARDVREGGVIAIISAIDNETIYGWKVKPEYVADIVSRYPEDFIGFMGADPHKGMKAVKELEWAVKTFGFKGVDVQPKEHLLNIDDPLYYPIYAKAQELGIVVYVACSVHYSLRAPLDCQHPRHLDRAAMAFPETVFVARHAGWPWVLELVAVAMRHPNVWLDLSAIRPRYLNPELLTYVERLFSDRTVYGTLYPQLPIKRTVEEFKALPSLREETKQKILYENSRRLLNIP